MYLKKDFLKFHQLTCSGDSIPGVHSVLPGVWSRLQACLALRTKESPKKNAENKVKSYSQQYYIINFKIAERLDVKYSHHKKEIIVV